MSKLWVLMRKHFFIYLFTIALQSAFAIGEFEPFTFAIENQTDAPLRSTTNFTENAIKTLPKILPETIDSKTSLAIEVTHQSQYISAYITLTTPESIVSRLRIDADKTVALIYCAPKYICNREIALDLVNINIHHNT